MSDVTITGVDTVLRNLSRQIKKVKNQTKKGMWEALLHIKGEAMEKTPVYKGNLVNSAYVTVTDGNTNSNGNFKGDDSGRLSSEHEAIKGAAQKRVNSKDDIIGEIGYTAYYAVYVHEIEKEYRKPGSSWKYLENTIKENAIKVLDFIVRSAKV